MMGRQLTDAEKAENIDWFMEHCSKCDGKIGWGTDECPHCGYHNLMTTPEEKRMNLYELHEKMTKHLFPAYSSEDERFLALALCGEAGELANMVKKRWRDGADLTEEIRDEIADIRVYLELLAKRFGIEGDKLEARVVEKLAKVAEKHKARLDGPVDRPTLVEVQ
jgi:NTP pyrophosphatase (non-canonical NTP hydrolase)/ribosomal protein L40E